MERGATGTGDRWHYLDIPVLAVAGKFSKPAWTDVAALVLAIAIFVFWIKTRDDTGANVPLQFVLLISFWPTVKGVWTGRASEGALPWKVAVVAYCFQVMAVLADWENTSWAALAFPIVNGIIGNGSVPIAMYIKERRSRLRLV